MVGWIEKIYEKMDKKNRWMVGWIVKKDGWLDGWIKKYMKNIWMVGRIKNN